MPIAAFYGLLRTIDRLHDRELAAALGDMVVAWSAAEYTLIDVFAAITGADWQIARAGYYRIPTFEARTKVLLAMLGKWGNESFPIPALVHEITVLNRCSKTRNHWVHGFWVQQLMGPAVSTFDTRDPERGAKPVKAADISNHVTAVQQHMTAIREALVDRL